MNYNLTVDKYCKQWGVIGKVVIHGTNGEATEFNVSGGFLSVANNRVSILTESVN